MTKKHRVILLDSAHEKFLDQVETLFLEMYSYMSDKGLMVPLADGGEKKWRVGVQRTLGRLGALVIAEVDGEVLGFMRGVVRLAPSHLGGEKTGFIDHTFVCEEMRGRGIGREMLDELQRWFRSKGVERLELQVLCGNHLGINSWKAMGFQSELLQMQKCLD